MSDQFNRDDKKLSFKEQILRDLEALKATIEADEASREAEMAQEEADLLEATEASLEKKFAEEQVSNQGGEIQESQNGSETESISDSEDVPDFVAEQAQRFADMRTQIDAKLSESSTEIDSATAGEGEDNPISEEADQASVAKAGPISDGTEADFNHKVPVTFRADQVDLSEFAAKETEQIEEFADEENSKPTVDDFVNAPLRSSKKRQTETGLPSRRIQKQVRKKGNKAAKRIVVAVTSVAILVLSLVSVALFLHFKGNLEPMDSKSTSSVQVEIPEGASAKEIGQVLVKEGLIRDANIFNYYTKFKNYSNFQSGYHSLQKSMSVDEIIKELQKEGSPTAQPTATGKITIPEGYTIKQIAEAVTKNAQSSDGKEKTHFSSQEFLDTVQDEAFINEMVAKYPNLLNSIPASDAGAIYRLEGYLFPATYDYQEETSVRNLIDQMLAAADAALNPYYEQIQSKGLTVNQVMTLASLVEKEGVADEDRRNIASVFFNRIQAGMPLQSNIAILYAEGKLGEKTSLKDDVTINTEIDSPYNNYVNAGYMPGPVDSPSLSAIEATINPSQTDYLYFVADVTSGVVYFATTFEEHEVNVQTYVNSNVNQEQ